MIVDELPDFDCSNDRMIAWVTSALRKSGVADRECGRGQCASLFRVGATKARSHVEEVIGRQLQKWAAVGGEDLHVASAQLPDLAFKAAPWNADMNCGHAVSLGLDSLGKVQDEEISNPRDCFTVRAGQAGYTGRL
ncbi:hypothetical protein TSA1_09645 [Bradyrhizobium nitroreducens]|uniref:Uncharacterized protein n=1 Tax=Bradyrhizobium nitroreducens TaxID=709803 RepID=A0A2M6U8S2_9BRAD|nr:hypothetical protein TSA1_09645 [Bradyrhizobium nitroreducens]